MRRWYTSIALVVAGLAVGAGCYDHHGRTITTVVPNPPADLSYQVDPSGNPGAPSGILLRWDLSNDPSLGSYRVYSRAAQGASFDLRGETTSNTFHDDGIPDLQYYVTAVAVDGGESDPSNVVTVDESLALNAPATLTSISLDEAVHLQWDDSPYQNYPSAFAYYRVYSTGYSLDQNLCDTTWSIEGTTVSPTFLVGALTNGVPRCYAVSAIAIEGYESDWSPLRADTPRPDARNVVLFSSDTLAGAQSGFRFWFDANSNGAADVGELGLVGASTSGTNDFILTRTADTLWLTPQRQGVTVTVYGSAPVEDLTSIDIAPVGGYAATPLSASPMWGYVFQIDDGGTYYKYGAIRVSAVGTNYVIFDGSYQTDPGNPELLRVAARK
jgi:hypothetical protein